MSDFDELERLELAAVVTLLAKDALDQTDKVIEQYKRLEGSKSFAVFEVFCEHGSMSSQETADELNQAKSDVNNWLKAPINFWDRLIPFYRPEKGRYSLSTTGMYLRERYYEAQETTLEKETDAETDSKASGEDDSESSDTQSTLADIGSESTEPIGTTEGQNTEAPRADTAQEKADRMFSNIGDEECDES